MIPVARREEQESGSQRFTVAMPSSVIRRVRQIFRGNSGRPHLSDPIQLFLLTAFVIFEAAYLGEIVRAGIQSVPRGQSEAATATGLSYGQTMFKVILPQAIRNMLPSLVTQFIVLFKDTSLASIIGMMDLTKAAQTVASGRSALSKCTCSSPWCTGSARTVCPASVVGWRCGCLQRRRRPSAPPCARPPGPRPPDRSQSLSPSDGHPSHRLDYPEGTAAFACALPSYASALLFP